MRRTENEEPALLGVIRGTLISCAMWLAIVALCYVACTDRSEATPTTHHTAHGGTYIKAPFDWTC